MAEAKKAVTVEPKPKIHLTITQIKKDLEDGIDRKAMAKKYNVPFAEILRLFRHEKLKGLKVKNAPIIELEDDTEDEPVKATANKTKVAAKPKEEVPEASNQPGIGETPTTEKGVW